MIGIFRGILTHISSVDKFFAESFSSFLDFDSMTGVIDEGNGWVLTLFNEDFLTPLVSANDDLIEYLRYFFHSFLPEVILLRLVSTSMMLNHILRVVYRPQILEVNSYPLT